MKRTDERGGSRFVCVLKTIRQEYLRGIAAVGYLKRFRGRKDTEVADIRIGYC